MVRLRSSKDTNLSESPKTNKRRKHIEIEMEENESDINKEQIVKIKKQKNNKEIKTEKVLKKEKFTKKSIKKENDTQKKDNSNDNKIDKNETKLKTPVNWLQTYNEIKEYREKNEAPVDTQGCERLANEDLPPKQFRYQVLISLMLSSQTKDQITAEAIQKLQKKGLTIENILKMSEKEIDKCIEKVGFHNRKA
eukprot:jgi/Orpsp1_1/1191383/evm.model.d7180000085330.1